MSPRARVSTVVGACAVGAAAAVVGITAATHHSLPEPKQACSAATRAAAGTVAEHAAAVKRDPGSAEAELRLGFAYYCAGDSASAVAAWRAARRLGPDTPWAVRAEDLLHPDTPRGLPQFQPSFARATTPAQRKLVEGVRLQQAQRPVSAERAFRAALRLAPNDPDANVAAAVGLYDKGDPTPAFSRLGPLTRRFPQATVVRFHLGLLAIWIRDFPEARKQFRLTVRLGPRTAFAREAKLLLGRLGKVGTG